MVDSTQPPTAKLGWQNVILDSVADGVFTVDRDWLITYFNRAAEQITGIDRHEAEGRRCFEVFKASICEEGCCLRRSMTTGEPLVHKAAYVVKNDGKRIPISISTAVLRNDDGEIVGGVETFRDLSVVETLRQELQASNTFHDIVSKSEKLRALFRILPQVSEADATVLLQGESGTGKELFAHAIHSLSRNANGPFVAVNCAALPDTLLESELFGYKAGAFTDARRDKLGRFELAEGGTIFLDEIGDISPALQVRLLRVLQERTIEPLGGTETKKIDVRVIAATNRDLKALVNKGGFRKDLYYRICVVSMTIPPLRDRSEDIPLLVEHYIARFNRLQGKEVSHITPEALAVLLNHDFPGNVRELMNVIEHAFVLCPGGTLLVEHLPGSLQPARPPLAPASPQTFREMETIVIRAALERNNHNRAATAADLGIHKTTLWRKMRKLGIAPPERKI